MVEDEQPKAFQPFRFLELPGELRNAIYRYALVSPKTFRVKILFAQTDSQTDTALLRVSKQVYAETLKIFYSENKFWLPQSLFIGPPIIPVLEHVYRVSREKLRLMTNLILDIPVGNMV